MRYYPLSSRVLRFRSLALALAMSLALVILIRASIYHTIVSAAAGPPILQQVSQAFSTLGEIKQITLSGTVNKYAGSLNDSGSANIVASEDGSGTISFDFSKQGAFQETAEPLMKGRICQWQNASGKSQDSDSAVCAVPLPWALPSLALQPTAGDLSFTDEGIAPLNGGQYRVLLLTASDAIPPTAGDSRDLGTARVGLDPNTLLPTVVEYHIVPNSNPMAVLRIDVTYGNYGLEHGVQVPHSIQRRINGSLELDIAIQSVSLN
jgi:hypothetical protein